MRTLVLKRLKVLKKIKTAEPQQNLTGSYKKEYDVFYGKQG